MDAGEEVAGKFVVAGCDAPEVLEPAKAAFDDVPALVGALVEAMQVDPVGLVRNDRPCSSLEDQGSEGVSVVAFVSENRPCRRGERQHIGGRGNVGILPRSEKEGVGPTVRVAQRVDFRRPPATRLTDRLGALPPFPPAADLWALIDVESSDKATGSLRFLARA